MKKWIHNIYIQMILMCAAVVWTLDLRTSNIFAAIVLLLLYWFLNSCHIEQTKLEKGIVTFLSALFSIFWVAGNYEVYSWAGAAKILQYLLSVIGLYLLIEKVLSLLIHWLLSINLTADTGWKIKPWKFALLVFFICIVCWLPYFLAYYPGIITDDAEWQLTQAIGLRSYSNHQPWIHTMIHKVFYQIGYSVFHTPNAGVASCVLGQMVIMAGSYAYLLMTFYKEKVGKRFLVGCLIYFALFPINALYAVTLWKDVLLGAVVLILSLSIWKMTRETCGVGNYIVFFLTGILLCILRSNGFYAYLLCVPFLIYFLKGKRKVVVPVCAVTVALTVIYKGPVLNYFHVAAPDTIESLSIPAQHIARVIADDGELTEEQRELLEKAVDVNQIKDVYFPTISDPIKTLVRQTGDQEYIAEHKGEYLKLWIELGLEYPATYIKAQIDQTKGYWYPDVQYWVTTTMMKENSWGMYRDSKLPDIAADMLSDAENVYQYVPVLGLFWSIGFYTWTLLVLAGCAVCRKTSILPFLPVLAILLSLFIATPVQAEFRYSYAMVTAMPLFIMIGCTNYAKEKKDGKNCSVNTVLQ